jgi:hypothetical protein
VVLSELATVAWMIYGYFRRSAIGGVSGIVRNRRDHILAVQVLLGNGRVGEDLRYAAASASACFYLVFDCGCAVLCRGVYSPAPIMKKAPAAGARVIDLLFIEQPAHSGLQVLRFETRLDGRLFPIE